MLVGAGSASTGLHDAATARQRYFDASADDVGLWQHERSSHRAVSFAIEPEAAAEPERRDGGVCSACEPILRRVRDHVLVAERGLAMEIDDLRAALRESDHERVALLEASATDSAEREALSVALVRVQGQLQHSNEARQRAEDEREVCAREVAIAERQRTTARSRATEAECAMFMRWESADRRAAEAWERAARLATQADFLHAALMHEQAVARRRSAEAEKVARVAYKNLSAAIAGQIDAAHVKKILVWLRAKATRPGQEAAPASAVAAAEADHETVLGTAVWLEEADDGPTHPSTLPSSRPHGTKAITDQSEALALRESASRAQVMAAEAVSFGRAMMDAASHAARVFLLQKAPSPADPNPEGRELALLRRLLMEAKEDAFAARRGQQLAEQQRDDAVKQLDEAREEAAAAREQHDPQLSALQRRIDEADKHAHQLAEERQRAEVARPSLQEAADRHRQEREADIVEREEARAASQRIEAKLDRLLARVEADPPPPPAPPVPAVPAPARSDESIASAIIAAVRSDAGQQLPAIRLAMRNLFHATSRHQSCVQEELAKVRHTLQTVAARPIVGIAPEGDGALGQETGGHTAAALLSNPRHLEARMAALLPSAPPLPPPALAPAIAADVIVVAPREQPLSPELPAEVAVVPDVAVTKGVKGASQAVSAAPVAVAPARQQVSAAVPPLAPTAVATPYDDDSDSDGDAFHGQGPRQPSLLEASRAVGGSTAPTPTVDASRHEWDDDDDHSDDTSAKAKAPPPIAVATAKAPTRVESKADSSSRPASRGATPTLTTMSAPPPTPPAAPLKGPPLAAKVPASVPAATKCAPLSASSTPASAPLVGSSPPTAAAAPLSTGRGPAHGVLVPSAATLPAAAAPVANTTAKKVATAPAPTPAPARAPAPSPSLTAQQILQMASDDDSDG